MYIVLIYQEAFFTNYNSPEKSLPSINIDDNSKEIARTIIAISLHYYHVMTQSKQYYLFNIQQQKSMLSGHYVFTFRSSLPSQDFFAIKKLTRPLYRIIMLIIIISYSAYNLCLSNGERIKRCPPPPAINNDRLPA